MDNFLHALGDELSNRILRLGTKRVFAPNQYIFFEGDTATFLPIVWSGKVKMVRFPEAGKEIIIGAFQSGEIFAIPPAMDGKSFPETAAAVEESELLLLKRMDFLALMGSSSKFSTIVMSRMCDLNVVSLMGMIMVVGIVARNGILMLDAVTANVTKSANFNKALIVYGHRRFRPVLMTSLTAILGMLPLALAIGEGSGLLQLLAIAVIGGLIFEPALSLIVTPTVY